MVSWRCLSQWYASQNSCNLSNNSDWFVAVWKDEPTCSQRPLEDDDGRKGNWMSLTLPAVDLWKVRCSRLPLIKINRSQYTLYSLFAKQWKKVVFHLALVSIHLSDSCKGYYSRYQLPDWNIVFLLSSVLVAFLHFLILLTCLFKQLL